MKTAAPNCFTYLQLSSFAGNQMQSEERLHFIKHMQDCELCYFALLGFEEIPFSQSELSDIESKMTHRIESQGALELKYAFLGLASVLIIAAFYYFADSFAHKPKAFPDVEKTVPLFSNIENVTNPGFVYESRKQKKGRVPAAANVKETRKELYTPEPLSPIIPTINTNPRDTSVCLPPVFNNDYVFIHHLKVAAYWNLYFKSKVKVAFSFNNHTPPVNENRNILQSLDDDMEFSEPLAAILEKGLLNFSQERYRSAIAEFQKLLSNSPDDINALFYLAMAYSKVGANELSVSSFNRVLNHPDKAFAEEAKWHLALVHLSASETDKAKSLLEEIVAENGFYAKNAEKELAAIKK